MSNPSGAHTRFNSDNAAWTSKRCSRRACAPQARNVEKVSISGDALFPLNKDEVRHITAAGRERLEAFAKDLRTWKSIERIVVVGHTDRLGTATYNDGLSRRRADNIRAYLIRSGLPADRIVAAGHGGCSPLVQCADGTGRQALVDCLQTNRRVEIIVSGDRE